MRGQPIQRSSIRIVVFWTVNPVTLETLSCGHCRACDPGNHTEVGQDLPHCVLARHANPLTVGRDRLNDINARLQAGDPNVTGADLAEAGWEHEQRPADRTRAAPPRHRQHARGWRSDRRCARFLSPRKRNAPSRLRLSVTPRQPRALSRSSPTERPT